MKKKYVLILFAACIFSCKKNWLDVKSSKSDVVPKSLSDFQAILDNDDIMNSNYPNMGNLGSDNYYVTYEAWQAAFTPLERNAYIWARDIYAGGFSSDWNLAYKIIEYSNIVLDGLAGIHPSAAEQAAWNNARGSALFYRSCLFFELAQLFAKPYDSTTASTDPGIPVRLTSDVNAPIVRNTLQETYSRLIADLTEAAGMLPDVPLYTTRPSKAAAQGLLARVYFNMEAYSKSMSWSETYLASHHALDYNTLDPTAFFSMPDFQTVNPEVVFYCTQLIYSLDVFPIVDTLFYRTYTNGDLRRDLFYKDDPAGKAFTGFYTGSVYGFGGIATNEIMLMDAECKARAGDAQGGMDELNTLLSKRYASGSFIPLTASGPDDAITKIIIERRKELPFTGSLRWQELRRLNKDPLRATTLTRSLNGTTYTLPPGDQRYVYPIPPDEIKLSGIAQNPR